MKNDMLKTLVSKEELESICKRIGNEITNDYKEKKPILIGLLKGCEPFMSDLLKYINTYVNIDYMSVSSYEGGTSSTGNIRLKKDIEVDIKNQDIIIIDDIIDTGLTLYNVIEILKQRNPKSIKTICLLDKPEGRKIDIKADYIGTTIKKEFVVGYGLDYKGFYRNYPEIAVLKPEIYNKN